MILYRHLYIDLLDKTRSLPLNEFDKDSSTYFIRKQIIETWIGISHNLHYSCLKQIEEFYGTL